MIEILELFKKLEGLEVDTVEVSPLRLGKGKPPPYVQFNVFHPFYE